MFGVGLIIISRSYAWCWIDNYNFGIIFDSFISISALRARKSSVKEVEVQPPPSNQCTCACARRGPEKGSQQTPERQGKLYCLLLNYAIDY